MTIFSLAIAAVAASASSRDPSCHLAHRHNEHHGQQQYNFLSITGGSSSSRLNDISRDASSYSSKSSVTNLSGGSTQGIEQVRILAQGYYDDDYDEDGYGGTKRSNGNSDEGGGSNKRKPQPKYQPKRGGLESLLDVVSPETRRNVGATLLMGGGALTLIGMTLFFERNLLRLGNICIILGVPLLIGPSVVYNFFMQPKRAQATIITAMGIFLVFIGKPRLGILMEIFGLLNLIGNMLPLLMAVAKRLPIIGDVIAAVEQGASGAGQRRPEFSF